MCMTHLKGGSPVTRTTLMRLAVLFSFAPCPAAFAQSGTPHDQAMAKLTQCMQMPAGSKQQAQCMDEVKALKA